MFNNLKLKFKEYFNYDNFTTVGLVFLGFILLFLPLILFIYRFVFKKDILINISYPFNSYSIYLYVLFLFIIYLMCFYKLIKCIFIINEVQPKNKYMISLKLHMEAITYWINYPIEWLSGYMLYELKLLITYQKIFVYFLYVYDTQILSRKLIVYNAKFYKVLMLVIYYVPMILFMSYLYYEVLILSKLHYVYYIVILLFIGRIFSFMFDQFMISMQSFYDDFIAFIKFDYENYKEALKGLGVFFGINFVIGFCKIDEDHEYYKKFTWFFYQRFLKEKQYSEDSFNKIVGIQKEFQEYFSENLFFMFGGLFYINQTKKEWLLYKQKHMLISNLIRLILLLILIIIVLFKNFIF